VRVGGAVDDGMGDVCGLARFANRRALSAWLWAHPGTKLHRRSSDRWGQLPQRAQSRYRQRVLTLVLAVLSQAPTLEAGLPAATALVSTPYEFGGRLRRGAPGVDCLGVVFAAAEAATGCGWKSYPVKPTELVRQRVLGAPVEGLSPVTSAQLDTTALRPGDVLLLLSASQNPAEPALATVDGRALWVWHTGLALGDGKWVVGDHFAGQTVVTDLRAYLNEHPDYEAVFVLRGPLVKPKPCRQHARLGARR